MQKALYIVLSCFLFTASIAQMGKEQVKVTDLLKIKSIGGVTLSKDGSKAAFTVTTIEPDDDTKWEYKYVTQVWIVNTDGNSTPRQLTSKENSSQPAFSPDGKQVAFVRPVDGRGQIFLLSLDGGEATQLTKFKYGAGAPRWNPDGKQLLFSSTIPLKELIKDSLLNPRKEVPAWPYEKPGFVKNENLRPSNAKADPDGSRDEVRAYLEQNVADRKARVVNKLNFQDETDVNPDISFTNFFIVDAKADAKPRRVTRGFYRYNFADFFPDGKKLLISGNMDSLVHPDRTQENRLYITNLSGDFIYAVWGRPGYSFTNPRISPSGSSVTYLETRVNYVAVPQLKSIGIPHSLEGYTELEDNSLVLEFYGAPANPVPYGRTIYFTAQSNGGVPLYKVEQRATVRALTDSNSGIGSFDFAGDKLVYVKTEVNNPFELYVADVDAKNPKRLTSFNHDWVQQKKLSIPEKYTFTNDKGQTVEYWVMKPTNYEPGKKYPLLLEIHGGPSAMWGPGESTMWHEYQFFCSKGYGVVYCNPRGSGGYGTEFLRANINDWGAGPTRDVLTALDKTIALGWADTSKLLITGGSYAGYLVAWIVAHDQRFKAACSQRGVYDLATFFGEGNAWRLVPNYFGGYPWDAATKLNLERESPINYVQNIKTPYIIFHGENDRRTGVIQSEMLYRSLKALGRPVEYVRHPGATHEITRSGNNRQRIDQMLRTWEFFERWIH